MRLAKTFRRMMIVLVALGTGGVVYFGGSLALDKAILPGTLVLFVAYLKKLYSPLDKFAEMMLEVAKSQVSGERLLELLECDMVMEDNSHAMPAPKFKGRIEYRHVSFGYKKGVQVLKNLNFVAAPGETVALVGHSGAGKSTLISLLLRFYDPHAGQILIDGCDIREFTLQSLRNQITVVMQEARLFNKTVRDNIGFGKIDATEEEILQAAKLAQAHDFIMQMPEGYDTMIAEGGENLSGGQQQRLNIARAIIRNTPIVILDEPATALDAKSEAKIQAALHELARGKTAFIIAHKFSTLAHADKILVLEEGKLTACGTHEELLRTNRAYYELYELQFDHKGPPTGVALTSRRLEYATEATEAIGGNGKLAALGAEETLQR
jgi:ATP-binding cassette subfamily B protein